MTDPDVDVTASFADLGSGFPDMSDDAVAGPLYGELEARMNVMVSDRVSLGFQAQGDVLRQQLLHRRPGPPAHPILEALAAAPGTSQIRISGRAISHGWELRSAAAFPHTAHMWVAFDRSVFDF